MLMANLWFVTQPWGPAGSTTVSEYSDVGTVYGQHIASHHAALGGMPGLFAVAVEWRRILRGMVYLTPRLVHG